MRDALASMNEIVSDAHPDLRLDVDPKTGWALRNRDFFPININKASKEALLRIPGIGVQSVQKVLRLRRLKQVTLEDLQKMRCVLKRARPFIITADWHPRKIEDTANLLALIAPPPPQAQQMELAL